MGDSFGDLKMSHNFKHNLQLSIGFLNHDTERLFERYAAAFDIVICGDASLEWITNLIAAISD